MENVGTLSELAGTSM